jgi:hypothetical protein
MCWNFLIYFGFFNYILRNELSQFFLNLVIFSRTNSFYTTYKAVMSCALTRLSTTTKSRRLLYVFNTVKPSHTMCTDVSSS